MKEYVAYIKKTKSGRFRNILGSLHDVGEPDGDKLIFKVATSDMFDELQDAIDDLLTNCKSGNIQKYSVVPIIGRQLLFESELTLSETT